VRHTRPRIGRMRAMIGTLGAALIGATLAIGIAMPAHAEAPAPDPAATPEATEQGSESGFAIGGRVRNGDEPLAGVEILVEGDGFEQVGVTDDAGEWSVPVPARGAYTATLDVDTLPDGVSPRDPDNVTRDVEIGTTNTVNVLFPTVEGDAPAAAPQRTFLDTFVTRLIYGLNFGLLLALAAIGITLIFGTTGVNNFAHGEMLTFGAIIFWAFVTLANLPAVVAAIITLLLSAAFGWLQDAALFKPLRRRGVGLVQVLIVTIGLSIVLRYGYLYFYGGGTESIQTGLNQVAEIGPVRLQVTSLVSMGISAVVLVLVGLFLTRTRIGKATRAVSDNAALAASSGINVDRVIRIVWVLAGTLTGLSGILYGIFRGVTWDMGFAILLLLFASVTLGGLGSAFGALVGALIIGLFTELATLVVQPDLRYAVALIVLILVLLLRPQGVLGRKERIG
jgi:neutral amino acid transport system permease protein